MKMLRRSYSQERECKNPVCKNYFIPHDKRQVYCSRQCQINYNNDKKNEAYEEVKYMQKLEQSDLILEYLYTHAGGAQYSIKENMLKLNKVDLTIGTSVLNKSNGNTIRWYINYGLECIDIGNYFIYCRN